MSGWVAGLLLYIALVCVAIVLWGRWIRYAKGRG